MPVDDRGERAGPGRPLANDRSDQPVGSQAGGLKHATGKKAIASDDEAELQPWRSMSVTKSPPWSNKPAQKAEGSDTPQNRSVYIDLCWDDEECTSVKKRKRNIDEENTKPENDDLMSRNADLAKLKKLKQLIKTIEDTSRELTKQVAQNVNTKKEIKEAVTRLRTNSSLLNTAEMQEFINALKIGGTTGQEKIDAIPEMIESSTQTSRQAPTADTGVQTSSQFVSSEEQENCQTILNKLSICQDMEGCQEIMDINWPEECYIKTVNEQGSILEQATHDTVIVIDTKKQNSRLLDDLAEAVPQLRKVIKEGIPTNKIFKLTQNSTLLSEDDSEETNRRLFFLLGIDSEQEDPEVTKFIYQGITKIQRTAEIENRNQIALASTTRRMAIKVRKVCEYIFRNDKNKDIRIFGIPPIPSRSYQNKQEYSKQFPKLNQDAMDIDKSEKLWQKAPRKNKSETLLIKLQNGETDYAEIVKSLKRNINIEEIGVNVRSIRKTKGGNIQMKIDGSRETQAKFAEAVKINTANKGVTDYIGTIKTIFIKDLDTTVEKEDIVQAICTKLQCTEEDIKVEIPDKPNKSGFKHAFVKTNQEYADKIIEGRKIKVGWTYCRVEETFAPIRCYNCGFYGHIAGKCPNPTNIRYNKCLNCTEEGHTANGCIKPPICYMCTENRAHKPNSMSCPSYRKAVVEWRRERKSVTGTKT